MEVGRPNLYQVLVDRCQSLEANQARLREQFDGCLLKENEAVNLDSSDDVSSEYNWGFIPGFFHEGNRHRSILESLGHALHVCAAPSEKIIYWNRSAEILYGWSYEEVLGQRVTDLLIGEEFYAPHKVIMEQLAYRKSWAGQFPFKKRSGQVFMALVTKSPLYEDGKLTGIITVSSDAAVFNSFMKTAYHIRGRQQHGFDSSRIQWHPPRPQIESVPQRASSISNLASKLKLRRRGDAKDLKSEKSCTLEEELSSKFLNVKITTEGRCSGKDESALPSKIGRKFLAKLNHIRNRGGEDDGIIHQNGATDISVSRKSAKENNFPRGSKASISNCCTIDGEYKKERTKFSSAAKTTNANVYDHRLLTASEESCGLAYSKECNGSFVLSRRRESLPTTQRLHIQEVDEMESDGEKFPHAGESNGDHEISSSKRDNESNGVNCDIRWENLQLGEEIGQGSFAVVYRGIWNGSDVAVKVFFGNEYCESTLKDYQKEIDIMKKLRHPNVLLFMGAVYSQEKLAIVTEFLPRGSLFKALHKNKQAIDTKRRLRMALDIARGVSYLHNRNPPIVHRDLKTSNLLVDKNWTVKVGDFGLSKWMNATFLSARSGRGTPQWMAPEVLRNEPSNEKSDVFSFGVILWELMTVSVPWKDLNPLQVVGVVGFMDRRLDLPEGLDPQISSIIQDCWHSDARERPSFKEIIQRMSGLLQRAIATSARKNSKSDTAM